MNPVDRLIINYKSCVGPGVPGRGAYAFEVFRNEVSIHRQSELIADGMLTPIQAQYKAILPTFEWLLRTRAYKDQIRFYGDNAAVVMQINGIWPTVDNTAEVNSLVQVQMKKFRDCGFTWVAKKQVELVTKLATETLREKAGIVIEPPRKKVVS